jgi:hypothetical protein
LGILTPFRWNSCLSFVVNPNPKHVWKFFRAGGLDQVRFETAGDFLDLGNLDQKLWVALSCPTHGLYFDERMLALVDTDRDGHIRASELIAAVQWACQHLKDPAVLAQGSAALPLSAINDATESGARVLAAARRILQAVGKPDAPSITVEDTADPARIFGQLEFNGDGVLSPLSLGGDANLRQVFDEIIAAVGTVKDRSGLDGVDAALVAKFFEQLAAYDAWARQGGQLALPLGAETAAAFAALQAVRTKVADYFSRCQLAAFDARAAAPLNRAETEFVTLAGQDLSKLGDAVAALPLARVEAGRALPLVEGVNPAWAAPLAAFRTQVVESLFGGSRNTLAEVEWHDLLGTFASFDAHVAAKPVGLVEKLGIARIRELLAGNVRARLESLIQQDLDLAPEIAAIDSVERLIRYHWDLGRLLNNFVSFTDFYAPDRRAPFQAGTLYLDGRSCNLCVAVSDPGAHSVLAAQSNLCIVYCDCRRADGATKKIAACFTKGDSDYLMVGRNGVFYDRKGGDWDATIVKVVENVISLHQAFWLPYKKLVKFIEGQAVKFAAAKDKSADDKLAAGIANAAGGGGQPAKTEAFDIGKFAGIFAAIGLALGYIGGALAAIVVGFVKLAPWQMPLAIAGAFLLISGPSMLLAWLKLRQRTLGPVLDATGWAINGRIKINVPLGAALTHQARLPANSHRTLTDPYEDTAAARRRRWTSVILFFVVLGMAAWFTREYWWWRVTGGSPPAPTLPAPTAAPESTGPGAASTPPAQKPTTPSAPTSAPEPAGPGAATTPPAQKPTSP